jgi:hypothetical protein
LKNEYLIKTKKPIFVIPQEEIQRTSGNQELANREKTIPCELLLFSGENHRQQTTPVIEICVFCQDSADPAQ